MHIVWVSHYFPPETNAPANRVYELSREWIQAGHQVTVVTAFPNHPHGVKRSEDQGVLMRVEQMDGIHVIRVYLYAAPNSGAVKRMLSFATFMLSTMLMGPWLVAKPDVVIATSPQLLSGLGGWFLARVRRVPFIFEVRDLWPETVLVVGAMKEGFLVRRLRAIARFLYFRCNRIVTVGAGYRAELSRLYAVPPDKVALVPNGIDTARFVPRAKDNPVRARYGWAGKRVFLYIGTHGVCQGLNSLLDVAARFRDREEVLFALVGEGAEKTALQKRARVDGIRNVQFIENQPTDRVPDFYAACDVGMVFLRDDPLFRTVIPSKMFEYMGMACPIIVSVGGEADRLCEDAGAGICVPPEDVNACVEAVEWCLAHGDKLQRMGQAGREFVLKKFDRHRLAKDYMVVLTAVVHAGADAGASRSDTHPRGDAS